MIKKLITRVIVKIEKSVDRAWFIPLIGFLSALDLFVIFVPIDAIIISSVLLRPKKWLAIFMSTALGAAIGALCLGAIGSLYGESAIRYFVHDALNSPHWLRTVNYLNDHGAWALAFISLGPIPQQPAVALCGMAHMPLYEIFLSVLLARLVKYGAFAWSAVNAPSLLRKLKFIKEPTIIGTLDDAQQMELKKDLEASPQTPK